MKAVIHFDGGCEPNPGSKYGSFSILLDDQFNIQKTRFPLGHGTNNEAEFESLIEALNTLFASASKARVHPKEIEVDVFTDSTIVRNWINSTKVFKPEKCKDARRVAMGKLAARCVGILSAFRSFRVTWNSREVNVEKFGH